MRFGVLGRLEVCRDDGRPLPVTAPAQRQVLAALLARAGSLVTAATLIDDLWGYAPPRSAVGSLRSHVARLRDALGRDQVVLLSEGDGYRLRVDPDDVDAGRFERLVREAGELPDSRCALEFYDQALALWRDEAYLDFGEAPFAVGERIRLAELRSLARERRTDLALEIGMAAELIGELEQRVRAEPYRERGWEQLVLALYRSARQADALATCRRARTVLIDDLGVEPGPGLQGLEQRLLRQEPDLLITKAKPAGGQSVLDRCPYLGLRSYQEDDVALFVGRERLTSMLAGRLADQSVVLITGGSGVGKSSLLRAGLIPALRNGALPGSASWRTDIYTPSAAALLDDRRRPDLIVLDQAEELFTALEPAVRDDLVKRLVDYVQYGGTRLVVVLRSDFLVRLTELEALAPFAEKGAVLVGPMRTDELRRALVEPAAIAGLRLEDELVETVLDDVAGQPEPLPLLSEAMVRTWRRRDADLLTLDGYQRAGAVAGALEAAAEECYARLSDDARRAARHVLVRMATSSGSGGWVRRPLVGPDIPASGPEREAIDALVGARLAFVADRRVELAHDALLEHWPRLRGWLDERALAAELVDHLDRSAAAWRAAGRQDADLYRGARLSAALDWRREHPGDVSREEDDFLEASSAAAQAELDAARAQLAREERSRRALRRVAVALAGVVVLALAVGAIALYEQRTESAQAQRAERAALAADVNRLSTLAGTLTGDDRGLALLLGAEAYELQPSDQSAAGLQESLMGTPPGLDRLISYPSSSAFPHLDQRGRLLAAPGADGSVTIYELATGRAIRTLHAPGALQYAVFSGDDRLVAAGGTDGRVFVWNLRTGRQSGSALPVGDGTVHPVFDPRNDGRLYAISTHGGLSEWDRSDPWHPLEIDAFSGILASAAPQTAPTLTISPDGRSIAAGEPEAQSVARIWDTRTRKVVRDFGGTIGTLAADSVTLPFGYGNDTVLMNARTGRIETTLRSTGGGALSTVSADGRRIAVVQPRGDTSAVAVYDVASGRAVGAPLTLHGLLSYPLGFLPDGRLVTSTTGGAAIWNTGGRLPPLGLRIDTRTDHALGDTGGGVFFLPRRRNLLTPGNGLIWHDGVTGRPIGPLLGGAVEAPVAGSPDGKMLLGEGGGTLEIWDLGSGRLIAPLPWNSAIPRPVVQTRGVLVEDEVYALRWTRRGDRIAAGVGGWSYVWNLSDPRHPSQPIRIGSSRLGVIEDLSFTPDGRRLVLVSAGPVISSVDVATGRTLWSRAVHDVTEIRQFAVAPDGATIVYDSGDSNSGAVTLLDAVTGKQLASIPEPTYGGVGYVDRGRWVVATADAPGPQAQLYDAQSLQPIGVPFPTADLDQDPISVDPAGTRFAEPVIYNFQRPLSPDPYVWTVDPAAWVRTACAIVARNLTPTEWHKYLPDRPYRTTCPVS